MGVPSPSSLHTSLIPWPLGMPFPSSTGLAEGSSTELSFLLIQIEGQRASMAHPAQVLPFSRKSLVKKKVVSLCCRAALALVVARGAPSQGGEAVHLRSWFLSSFPLCEITNVASPGQLEGELYNGSLTYCDRAWQLQTWWAPISF